MQLANQQLNWVLSSIAQSSSNGREGIKYDRNVETRENGKNENYRKGDIENCSFTLVSQNARGLRTDRVKRETIFNYLKAKGDIIFLQETHSTPESEIIWKNETGCEAFFSHGASNSCGVMTLFF